MCLLLNNLGANVIGYSLGIPSKPSLYELCQIKKIVKSYNGDIRDLKYLNEVFEKEKPDIVIHMAAQPIVRDSYKMPVYTYDVNVMGTVNVLECVRLTDSVRSFVNVTTDKVYLNRDLNDSFKEDEQLCGFDPYSNSKSCSELVTFAYKNSFFGGEEGVMASGRKVAISTCRAGNVIGGGDFANDRIIPDCVRSIEFGEDIVVRNPHSTRPYQHVLEPLYVYLKLAALQYQDIFFAGCYNVGPDDSDCITTGNLVDLFCDKWNANNNKKAKWVNIADCGPHEASFLKLDSSKARSTLDWKPTWNINEAMDKIVEWTEVYLSKKDVKCCSEKQINDFLESIC